jgi:hypothetical protein
MQTMFPKFASANFCLITEGTCTLRKAIKLILLMLLIGCLHGRVLFVLYGRKWLASWSFYGTYIWLLLPSCVTFYLYYFSLSRAGVVAEPGKRGKLVAFSTAATLVSLYAGVLSSLNTYGE